MKLAQKKMNRYYSRTDCSVAYRIAMVLHPGMKLEYFRANEWEEDWIEQAEELVREGYAAKYEKKTNDSDAAPMGNADPKSNDDDDRFLSFGKLSVATRPRPSEIEEFLSQPVESVEDPLKWWFNKRHIFPNLHRMALDYLSIPGQFSSHLLKFMLTQATL